MNLFKLGLKAIKEERKKQCIVLAYILFVGLVFILVKSYVPSKMNLDILFSVIYCYIAIEGIIKIIKLLALPRNSQDIYDKLANIGLIDENKFAPLLVKYKKTKHTMRFEFTSPYITLHKYKEYKEKIETALNIHITMIEQGEDNQNVIIEGVSAK